MTADTTEKGLESIIEKSLLENSDYLKGNPADYNADYALDTEKLEAFLLLTQEDKVQKSVDFRNEHSRHMFFERLKNDITKRGVIDVLRKGFRFNTTHFEMYYPLPSELSESGQHYYDANYFSITRQVHFSTANPDVSSSAYAASKAALTSFMRSCAKELAPRQIRANAIHPGVVETGMKHNGMVSDEDLEKNKELYLLKRFARPEEIAWAIIYLLSDASAWITGDNLILDGGVSI